MLPSHGYSFDQFASVHTDPADSWRRLCQRLPSAEKSIQQILEQPYVRECLLYNNIPEEEHELHVKKSLVILFEALGPIFVSKFMEFQKIGTILSVMGYAQEGKVRGVMDRLRTSDIQMAILSSVIGYLSFEFSGRSAKDTFYHLVNQLPMPFYKHKILVESFDKTFDDHTVRLN